MSYPLVTVYLRPQSTRQRAVKRVSISFLFGVFAVVAAGRVGAQLDFEAEPIRYDTAPVTDRVAHLQQRIDQGAVRLAHDDRHGYLPAVLAHLDIPISSQVLVFSKTSFQQRWITPRRPRALYFNDDVYVGWVAGGEIVEVASADPQLGAVFYGIPQAQSETPRFERNRGQCITCHASSRTSGVPGYLVRSVYPGPSGRPYFGAGTFTTDHRSPMKERWGGWYVTGTHGEQRHLGNVIASDREHPERMDVDAGANITDLRPYLDVSRYLAPHSDIVALLVLEHQTRMHNLITRANFETRTALQYNGVMNRALERPDEYVSESTQRRIAAAGDALVEYLLFADEFPLVSPVEGTSRFAEEFAARGPFDRQGRSLRAFDLSRRLMRYPCSYLIYSEPFDNLPPLAKQHVYRRLFDILTARNEDVERYRHLTSADRQAILEILRETKEDLPESWRVSDSDPNMGQQVGDLGEHTG